MTSPAMTDMSLSQKLAEAEAKRKSLQSRVSALAQKKLAKELEQIKMLEAELERFETDPELEVSEDSTVLSPAQASPELGFREDESILLTLPSSAKRIASPGHKRDRSDQSRRSIIDVTDEVVAGPSSKRPRAEAGSFWTRNWKTISASPTNKAPPAESGRSFRSSTESDKALRAELRKKLRVVDVNGRGWLTIDDYPRLGLVDLELQQELEMRQELDALLKELEKRALKKRKWDLNVGKPGNWLDKCKVDKCIQMKLRSVGHEASKDERPSDKRYYTCAGCFRKHDLCVRYHEPSDKFLVVPISLKVRLRLRDLNRPSTLLASYKQRDKTKTEDFARMYGADHWNLRKRLNTPRLSLQSATTSSTSQSTNSFELDADASETEYESDSSDSTVQMYDAMEEALSHNRRDSHSEPLPSSGEVRIGTRVPMRVLKHDGSGILPVAGYPRGMRESLEELAREVEAKARTKLYKDRQKAKNNNQAKGDRPIGPGDWLEEVQVSGSCVTERLRRRGTLFALGDEMATCRGCFDNRRPCMRYDNTKGYCLIVPLPKRTRKDAAGIERYRYPESFMSKRLEEGCDKEIWGSRPGRGS